MTFMQPERLSLGFGCYVMQTTATEFRTFAEECEQLATAAQSERAAFSGLNSRLSRIALATLCPKEFVRGFSGAYDSF